MNPMNTPSETLAKKITDRLVAECLIAEGSAKKMCLNLANGSLSSEDWRLAIELAVDGKKSNVEAKQ